MNALPPVLASEVSSRLLSVDPMMREAFNRESVTMSGAELEAFCSGVWLMGYADACEDMVDAPKGELPALAALIEASSQPP